MFPEFTRIKIARLGYISMQLLNILCKLAQSYNVPEWAKYI